MHPRWSKGDAIGRLPAVLGLAAVAVTVMLTAAGCSKSAASTDTSRVTRCGTTKTAANVPTTIEVARGQVSCSDAMTVEHHYSKQVAAGKAPGNGGGGPLTVDGWKCQGFPTPQVLKTGWASKCVRGDTEILAILATPS